MIPALADHARSINILLATAGEGQSVYLVGGAVRDLLLGQPLHDLDFTSSPPIKPLARALADNLDAALFLLDEERETYRIIEKPGDERRLTYDLARLRGADLHTDLLDRDFTINAIAIDLSAPAALIDPLGGAQDLQAHLLRPCSPQAFINDPVRVLRAVRLCVHFQLRMEPPTIHSLQAAIPGLQRVSLERQRDELLKMLSGPRPSTAIRLLDRLGIVKSVLPELAGMKGVQQSAPHQLDVWEHTLAVLQALEEVLTTLAEPFSEGKTASLWLGMASQRLGRYRPQLTTYIQEELVSERSRRGLLFLGAILHDCAKPAVQQVEDDGKIHFYQHEKVGQDTTRKLARRLKLSEDEVEFLTRLVGDHMRIHHLARAAGPLSRRSIYRFFQSAGSAGPGLVVLSLADTLATYGVTLTEATWQAELESARQLLEAWYEAPEVAVAPPRILTGDDIIQSLGVSPGPIVGQLLAIIREKQACGEVQSREQALSLAQELMRQGLSAEGENHGSSIETS